MLLGAVRDENSPRITDADTIKLLEHELEAQKIGVHIKAAAPSRMETDEVDRRMHNVNIKIHKYLND